MQDSSKLVRNKTADGDPFKTITASQHAIHNKTTVNQVNADSTVYHEVHADPVSHSTSSLNEQTGLMNSTVQTKSVNFFGSHELKVIHNGPQSLNRNTPDWIFPLLLLILASFAWLRAYYHKYFAQIVSAFFNTNLTNQVVRDENILVQRASILLNIVFTLVAALLLYFISIHFRWQMLGTGYGFSRYIFMALLISAVYAMKFMILKICGYLFKTEKEMAAYIFNIFLINNMLGILLVPAVALLAFSSVMNPAWIIYFSIFLAGSGFLYRVTRGIAIGFSSPVFSPYYLFLYLCTLEFAPLAVLVKILTGSN
ncbi:MAG: DUF4271 domain-containing protein [Bacteroidetes bacterium]|nr:DUF4271 domain-containing protein [Bacteroidota bacterium]